VVQANHRLAAVVGIIAIARSACSARTIGSTAGPRRTGVSTTAGDGTADGPLANPADPDNLPPNYNGAQELYRWFGAELTNPAQDHMGPMGRFMTAKDHIYPTRLWQLNDESVTIPGQSFAGQVVLIAGHNDSTPTPTLVASGAESGSPTPMTRMRRGNWGNGSTYDAGSGEAMGMAEVQALLRWYAATGTRPRVPPRAPAGGRPARWVHRWLKRAGRGWTTRRRPTSRSGPRPRHPSCRGRR
jgi:hypothetical protein